MYLGLETNAKVNIVFNGADKEETVLMPGDYIDPDTGQNIGLKKQPTHGAYFSRNIAGNFATVTLTNLSKSYYTDPNTGQRKNIAKIVLKFSNLKLADSVQPGDHGIAFFGYHAILGVNSLGIKSATVATPEFYDANGKLIDYVPGTAYLMNTSLSTGYFHDQEGGGVIFGSKQGANAWHVEHVIAGNGNKAYQVNSVADNGRPYATWHSGDDVYSDTNSNIGVDNHNDSGQAVIRLVPGGTLTFAFDDNTSSKIVIDELGQLMTAPDTNWYQYTFSTYLLPQGGKPAPRLKTSSTSYHYNVANAILFNH